MAMLGVKRVAGEQVTQLKEVEAGLTGKEADKQQSKAGAWVKAASSELGRCAGRVIIYGFSEITGKENLVKGPRNCNSLGRRASVILFQLYVSRQ